MCWLCVEGEREGRDGNEGPFFPPSLTRAQPSHSCPLVPAAADPDLDAAGPLARAVADCCPAAFAVTLVEDGEWFRGGGVVAPRCFRPTSHPPTLGHPRSPPPPQPPSSPRHPSPPLGPRRAPRRPPPSPEAPPLTDALAPPSTGRRRRRRAVVVRSLDTPADGGEAAGAALTAALTFWLDAMAVDSATASATPPPVSLTDARDADAALRAAASSGGVATADAAAVTAAVGRLGGAVAVGGRTVVPDGAPASSPAAVAALTAVTAATAILRVAGAPGCPPAARTEDALTAALDALRHHALANSLAPLDARLATSHRPKSLAAPGGGDADADEPPAKKGRKKAAAAAARAAGGGPGVAEVRAAVEAALPVAAAALAGVRPPDGPVLGLARAAAAALAVEGAPVLAAAGADYVSAAYRHAPSLRPSLLDALVSDALPHVPAARGAGRASRTVPAGGGAVIQPLSAALLQCVQSAAELPPPPGGEDVGAGDNQDAAATAPLAGAVGAAYAAADAVATVLLDRLATAKTVKADTAVDVKAAVDELVTDVAACVGLPAWPAAGPTLLRLAGAAAGAVTARATDPSVRQAAVDIVGVAAAALCGVVAAAEGEAAAAAALVDAGGNDGDASAGPAASLPGVSTETALLLAYLASSDAAASSDGAAGRASARRFLLARCASEWAAGPDGSAADARAAAAVSSDYTTAAAELDASVTADLTPDDAGLLARAAVAAGAEARARGTLLASLADAADPARQAPAARARALRALGAVARADPRAARSPELQAAVGRALRDEAASARQAAVDVVGAAIELDPALATSFFGTLVAASRDTAPSVRRAALKIIDERCVRDPSFPRAADAAVALIAAAADMADEGVTDAAARSLGELWFGGVPPRPPSSGSVAARSPVKPARSPAVTAPPPRAAPAERAARVAAAATALAAAAGPGLRLPLEAGHPLPASLKAALMAAAAAAPTAGALGGTPTTTTTTTSPRGKAAAQSPRGKVVAARAAADAGAAVAGALLDAAVVDLGDSTTPPPPGAPGCGGALLALHALTTAVPALAAPAADPARVVRALAPYVKPPPARAPGGSDPDADRAAADRLIAVLCVLASALSVPGAVRAASAGGGGGGGGSASSAAPSVAADLARDLSSLVNAHPYIAVVAASCRALAALAVPRSPAERAIGYWAARYLALLAPSPCGGAPRAAPPAGPYAARYLFVLGHLFRHGAAAIDRSPPPPRRHPPRYRGRRAGCLVGRV